MDINKYVGSKIKENRKKKGMNQTELGKLLGVKQNTVAGYEKGDWEVSYDNLFKLAEIFGIRVDDLFPPLEIEYKPLHEVQIVAEKTDDLKYGDLLLINDIAEKLLNLEGEERKKMIESLKLISDLFEKKDK